MWDSPQGLPCLPPSPVPPDSPSPPGQWRNVGGAGLGWGSTRDNRIHSLCSQFLGAPRNKGFARQGEY